MIAEMIPDLCCYVKTISLRGAQTHLQPRNPLVSDIQERTFLQTAVDSWEENESLFAASLFFFFIFIYLLFLRGLSPHTPAFSHSPNTYTLG